MGLDREDHGEPLSPQARLRKQISSVLKYKDYSSENFSQQEAKPKQVIKSNLMTENNDKILQWEDGSEMKARVGSQLTEKLCLKTLKDRRNITITVS